MLSIKQQQNELIELISVVSATKPRSLSSCAPAKSSAVCACTFSHIFGPTSGDPFVSSVVRHRRRCHRGSLPYRCSVRCALWCSLQRADPLRSLLCRRSVSFVSSLSRRSPVAFRRSTMLLASHGQTGAIRHVRSPSRRHEVSLRGDHPSQRLPSRLPFLRFSRPSDRAPFPHPQVRTTAHCMSRTMATSYGNIKYSP